MKTARICTLLTLWAGIAFAQVADQDKGALYGRVTDAGGQSYGSTSSAPSVGHPLPGANVLVEGPALSAPTGAIADPEGRYRLDRLPPGVYRVTVSYIGYRTVLREDIRVQAGSAAALDFSLPVAMILHEKIVVSASRKREKILDAPASVVVVESDEIQNRSTLNVVEHVKNAPAVDYVQTGLAQTNAVVRGGNNVFSGALLTLVDNRISRVPSLRFNAHNFIPVTTQDIDRIEVVLGPGSALYGPNCSGGVMHVITRSPIGSEGTTVRIGGGERSLRTYSLRHAGSINSKVGYKVSSQYYTGTDWKYEDPEEIRLRGSNPRNYDLERRTGEIRVDFQPTEDLTTIFSAGYTEANNVEMTTLGAAQARNWTYSFLQGRLRYNNLFAQVFYNRSNAGDTELLRTGEPVVDESSLTVVQLQHAAALGNRQRFTYGFDALWTRPNTGGTINGANENTDDINEYGGYLQSETTLSPNLDLVLAARVDNHNLIDEPVFSPRAALVVKPTSQQTLRFTYNRAFGTPTSTNLFLDLLQSRDPFGLGKNFQPALGFSPNIDIRAQGAFRGFTFRREAGGAPMFRSPFAPVAGLSTDQYIPLHDPQFTNASWQIARGAVLNAFLPQFQQIAAGAIAGQMIAAGMPADQAQVQAQSQAVALSGAFEGIVPQILPGLRNSMRLLNPETRGFDPVQDVGDIPRLKPNVTQTFEIGYKGVLGSKLFLTADVYRTRKTSFVGSPRVQTPNVFLASAPLSAALAQEFGRALQDPSAAQLAAVLGGLDAPGLGGNGDGTPVDELTRLFVAGTDNNGAAFIPFGTVSPEQATDPTAVLLTFRNFGQITHYGCDLSSTYYPNNAWTFSGNYSYLSDNVFPNVGGVRDVVLNAPRHKFNLGGDYTFSETGLNLGGRVRYRGPFRMASGVYAGDIEAATVVDLDLAYDLPIGASNASVTLNLNARNLLNNKHRQFIGAPEIGRMVSGGMTVRF